MTSEMPPEIPWIRDLNRENVRDDGRRDQPILSAWRSNTAFRKAVTLRAGWPDQFGGLYFLKRIAFGGFL
jgi:hypothetical protein